MSSARFMRLWRKTRHTPARAGRPLLYACVALLVVTLMGGLGGSSLLRGAVPVASAATQNAIQAENALPGDPSWDDFSSVATEDAISGFGSKISVNHGDSIDFYVTTTAASFTIDIFRTGWYGGVGARKVASLGSFPGVHQAIPLPDKVTGMVACTNWTKTTTFTVPSTWVTGVYLAKLTASSGNKSFIYFVVRDDGGHEAIAFQTSVTTYQAYNAWGGVSLYTNNTNGSVYPYGAATKVSFDRPFNPTDSDGAGDYLSFEYPFVRWAESQGYDLSYITDIDTATGNPLTNHKAFLSVGHDEYWTRSMRDNVTNAIANGVNVAFFSANTSYWQIRLEANASGVANRVEVGYKDFSLTGAPGPDPMYGVNNSIVTVRWRDAPVNQPENSFIGIMYQDQVSQNYAYVVQNSSNWIYSGTGFTDGTSIPGIVGYEYDKVWNNGFTPAGLTVLSNSPVVGCCEGSGHSYSNSSLYKAPSGAQVFAGGTITWSWGLDGYWQPGYVNAGFQRTTANILNTFIAGTPASAPAVTLSATSVSFGSQNVGTTSAAQSVTLTNSGTAALSISSIGLTGANAGDFAQTNTCPTGSATLAAGASCSLSVTFSPTASGSRAASVSIADNATGSPQSVSLSGAGVSPAPAVQLNPTSLTFSGQVVGSTSAAQSVTLTNSGTAALSITGISLAGVNAGDFAQTNTCPLAPSTLAAGANCAISVTFTPTATGSRSASLSIADSAAGSPQSVALTGTGQSAPAPAVTLSATSVSFGSQNVGTTSAAQSVTLTNSGTAALSISSIALAGANAGDFAQTSTCPTSPSTLAAGASCSLSVTFSPTAAGSRAASVTISDNATGSPQSVSLSGTGVTPAPAVTLSPTSVSFGSVAVGTTSSAQSVTLTNSGNAALSISSIGFSGTNAGDFAQANTCPLSPATLAAGANCAISVTFTPSLNGAESASLTITDNAGNSPQSVALSGTGYTPAPAVSLTPSSLSFGSVTTNTTSAAQTVTLKNTGTAALTISSIALGGTNANQFSQTSACPLSPSALAVNATCTISVTFGPTAAQADSASLQVTDNAAGSPQSVALAGTGVAPSTCTALFCDGFESGALPGAWTSQTTTGTTATLSVVTSPVHSGSHALKVGLTKGSGARNAYVTKTLATAQTAVYVKAWFNPQATGDWGEVNLISLYDPNGYFIAWVYYDPSLTNLYLYDGNGNLTTCSQQLPFGSWHSLELGDTGTQLTLSLDGASICSHAETGLGSVGSVNLGSDQSDNTLTQTIYVDDATIDNKVIP